MTLLVGVVISQSVVVELGLCQRHRRRRALGAVVRWGGGVVTFATMAAFADEWIAIIPWALLAFLALVITGLEIGKVADPKKIDDHFVWVKCGRPFVDALPERI